MSLLVEDIAYEPKEFHYIFNRGGNEPQQREGAEEYLKRQGCTKVLHQLAPEGPCLSFGIIEPIEVVRQRVRTPQYG